MCSKIKWDEFKKTEITPHYKNGSLSGEKLKFHLNMENKTQ